MSDLNRFRGYTESAIKSVLHIESLPTDVLQAAIAYDLHGRINMKHEPFRAIVESLASPGINQSWVVSRIAETLYMRDVIGEEEFDRINDNS